jgi:WD40 repeat protein
MAFFHFAPLMATVRQRAASFGRKLDAPLRWPKMTTRLLMILVALVALGFWAAMELPQLIDRSDLYYFNAASAAQRTAEARAAQDAALARASAIQSEHGQWRADERSSDELTERYFASRYEYAVADAEFRRATWEYHAKLMAKYRWARWFPWNAAPADDPPPSDPLLRQEVNLAAGEIYESVGGSCVLFSPTDAGLAVGRADHTIKLLEPPWKQTLASVPMPEKFTHSLVFSRDGTTLFALGYDGPLVRRFDVATGSFGKPIAWTDQWRSPPGRPDTTTALGCSPNGGLIAVSAEGFQHSVNRPPAPTSFYTVRLFEVRSGARRWEHRGTGHGPNSVAFAPDGKTVAFGDGPAVIVLDTSTGQRKKTLNPSRGRIYSVAYSPDGRLLAGAGSHETLDPLRGTQKHGQVTLWDARTWADLRTLDGPTTHAAKVAFSPDSRTVAAAGTGPECDRRDKHIGIRRKGHASEVRLWDVATGRPIWIFEGESESAHSLAVSPDGKTLAICDADYVYLVDALTGRLKRVLMETVWERVLPPRSSQVVPR